VLVQTALFLAALALGPRTGLLSRRRPSVAASPITAASDCRLTPGSVQASRNAASSSAVGMPSRAPARRVEIVAARDGAACRPFDVLAGRQRAAERAGERVARATASIAPRPRREVDR
jgi:hypothetical protein